MPDIANIPRLTPANWRVNSLSAEVSSVTNAPIIPTPKMLNTMKPTSIEKNTEGFCGLLNWIPNSIASINPIAESWLPYNAATNGRLVIVVFVQQWRSHAQKAQAQGCPRSAATDVAWPC